MFFQSPRPFGQHSTSYRSMSNSMHSSSSMTSLQATGPESGRSSAPPVYFASVYDSNRIGPSSGPPVAHTSISSTSSEQAKVFKESGFFRVNKNVVQDRYSSAGSGTSEVVSRNYQISKTTSSYDSGGASDRNMDSLQSDLRVQPSKNKVFQVQLRHANQQPPPWIRRTQSRESHSQLEQAAQNVTPYQEDYQRSSTSNQTSHLRPTSTIPFAEQHIPKGMANQSQPIPIFSTSGRNSVQPIHESGSFPETRVRSTAQFNASQVASDEQQQQQKPVAYQQLERRKNYATLHHVASPKMAPLQRRTSDSGLLKSNDNNGPENIAMFNVARGVRAELEQDPKFRRKADILASKIAAAESVTNTFSSPPLPAAKEQPRQSPSLRQIGNFFEQNVQQFHNMLHAKKQPPIPSVKPFNVEHVRSIFRTNDNNNKNNTSSNTTQPTTPPMQTQTVQNSSLLGKAINSLVEAHEAQKGILHAKLKEDIQTSGIITRTVIDTSRSNEAGGNTEKLAEQKVCSAAETGKHNIQRKLKVPDESVVDKPVNMVSTDKGAEMMKEIVIARSREEPVISQDVAIFEKDYDSVSTLALPRRLNQPFPVDETTCISGSEKDSANITSLPGILLKNGNNSRLIGESGVKTPKRVAFQCDTGDSIASATINSNESKFHLI
uniref:Uncharacterized protein n=1 Tax=Setaria digitata TaxID=48799 RepID=A0A915PKH8_9BILA